MRRYTCLLSAVETAVHPAPYGEQTFGGWGRRDSILSTAVFQNLATQEVESGSDWSLLVGQFAHIDHVTGFCSYKILFATDVGGNLVYIVT